MINSHGTGIYALIAAIGFAVSMLVTAGKKGQRSILAKRGPLRWEA